MELTLLPHPNFPGGDPEHLRERRPRVRPMPDQSLELDDPAVERGPTGAVPIVWPDLSKLERTMPLRDFLTSYDLLPR
jgi:hypothetical protein